MGLEDGYDANDNVDWCGLTTLLELASICLVVPNILAAVDPFILLGTTLAKSSQLNS